jgi:hypothetical protein
MHEQLRHKAIYEIIIIFRDLKIILYVGHGHITVLNPLLDFNFRYITFTLFSFEFDSFIFLSFWLTIHMIMVGEFSDMLVFVLSIYIFNPPLFDCC